MSSVKKRVLSGMQPSGLLHLGNLLGALENWKRLQEQYESYFCVADWHALTTNYADTGRIREYIREMLINWLAVGLDPEKCTLFIQSRVPEHAVLHLLFSMIVPIPWLERNPTYKEQQQELSSRDLTTYGFLGYPVLQAADILIYKAHFVPVGVDQLPHIELTREIARRFNSLYKEVFPVPEALL
ncbi:MAG: tryptophan--tRNA ligase, partial [Nitrospira sp.]|nr:tryptophan--tRNA ligase [Nitrospira sp.]